MAKEERRQPELRFKGFTDDWEQRELSDIVERVKSYSLSRSVETPNYTGTKYVHYGDIHTKVADKISNETNLPNIVPGDYETLRKGDMILADASEDYQGIATPSIIIEEPLSNIVAGLHTIALRPTEVYPLFLYYLFKSTTFRKYGYKTGTGMKVFGISVINLMKFRGYIPSLKEQKKIASILFHLDNALVLHQRKLNILKSIKQACLQKMLPSDSQIVPNLRFSNYSCNWTCIKLGEILYERNNKIPENEEYCLMSFIQDIGVTPKNEKYDRFFLVKNEEKKYKKTELGDFIYSSNNFETGSIGINNTSKAVISPVYSIFYSMNKFETEFINLISKRKDFINKMIRYRQGVVYGQWRVHESDFLKIFIRIPEISEQKKIVEYFNSLDIIIKKQQIKIDSMTKLKESFLKLLFP